MTELPTITFHWSHLLWLLLVPAAAMIAELTRRVRAAGTAHPKILRAEAAPGQLTLSPLASPALAARAHVRLRLWLGLGLVIVALARPQWGHVEEQVFDQAREILIAVDLSRSMLAPDVAPSRLDRAKLLITSLLERLEGERVGLIVFAGTAFLQSPLSSDYEILREFLPELNPEFLPEGGTNYTALLQTALEAFGKSEAADRFLIILSDGESTVDDWEKLVNPVRERSVKVLSLGIGTNEGAMLPDGSGGFVKDERGAVVLSRLNTSTLEDLARRSGGVYRDASRWVDLAELLRETVEAGRQGDFTEVSRIRRVERFQWALAPALLLLLWSFWREFPVHPRPRALPLQGSATASRGAAAARATVAAALAVFVLAVSPRATVAAEANALAAPLAEVVGRLAAQPRLVARDLAELAQTTVDYGQRLTASAQAPEPGAIADALEAVRTGRALDADAADWDKLREELEALQPPEEQKEQEQQQKPDEQQSEDSSQDQKEQEKKDAKDQQQSGEGESPEDKSDSGEPQDSESKQEPGDGSQDEGEQSPQQPSAGEDSAFGDMQEPPPPADAEPSQSETQQVGGQSERRPVGEENPALTVPLQKLEQLKQQDSPAQLYQLMQDPNARPIQKGRDW